MGAIFGRAAVYALTRDLRALQRQPCPAMLVAKGDNGELRLLATRGVERLSIVSLGLSRKPIFVIVVQCLLLHVKGEDKYFGRRFDECDVGSYTNDRQTTNRTWIYHRAPIINKP